VVINMPNFDGTGPTGRGPATGRFRRGAKRCLDRDLEAYDFSNRRAQSVISQNKNA